MTTDLFFNTLLCSCVWVHRSGLAGDSQNLGSRLSGSAGLPELEAVRGPLLHPQPLFSPHLQAAHAREPKVPHGGDERADSLQEIHFY